MACENVYRLGRVTFARRMLGKLRQSTSGRRNQGRTEGLDRRTAGSEDHSQGIREESKGLVIAGEGKDRKGEEERFELVIGGGGFTWQGIGQTKPDLRPGAVSAEPHSRKAPIAPIPWPQKNGVRLYY